MRQSAGLNKDLKPLGSEETQSEFRKDQPLAKQAADRLREMIVLDELRPGEKLRERHLAEVLNVSRTPMREALKILATEGLVELPPNRSALVAGFSTEEIKDKLQVIAVLEQLAGELACTNATDEDIAEIRALHYEMLAAYSREDRKTYFQLNQEIHIHIVQSSRNKALSEAHRRLNTQLYRVRYLSNLRNVRWHSAIAEHEELLNALVSRDGEQLGHLMRNHLKSTWLKFSEIKDDPRVNRIDENGELSEGVPTADEKT